MEISPLKQISILLVDSHELVREAIARLLKDAEDIAIASQLSSGEEALEYLQAAKSNHMRLVDNTGSSHSVHRLPDVILLDARMTGDESVSGLGGIETTRGILKLFPSSKIIAMSSLTTSIVPSQMLHSGARGFITKNASLEELLEAIRTVASGGHYVTPQALAHLATDPFGNVGGGLFDKLSQRELQIGQMLTEGKKVSQISTSLELSPKTVYSYRYRIFEKLGIRSDVELTILAVNHGLVGATAE